DVGSDEAAGLEDGAADGSAAIVPIGAAIEKTSSEICRPIRTLRRRKRRRDAADDPDIEKTPRPGAPTPRRTGARSLVAACHRMMTSGHTTGEKYGPMRD